MNLNVTWHEDFKGLQNISNIFQQITDMANKNILYLLYHFLNEICTIKLLVKQNETYLNNMQGNPLFQSLLHIIFKVLSYLLPKTVFLIHLWFIMRTYCQKLFADWSVLQKKYQKHLLCFTLICFSLSHVKFSRDDLLQRKWLRSGGTPTKQIIKQNLKYKNHYKFNF